MKKLFVLSVVVVLLLLAPIVTTAEEPAACNGLLKALENIPPDSPGYAKVLETAQTKCGEALDLAALVALYEETDGDNWFRNDNWLEQHTHHCDWYGVSCDPETGRVYWLVLPTNNLNGSIPPALGSMSNLWYLYLNDNEGLNQPHEGLTGTIPDELSNLSNLLYLALHDTNLGCWETQAAADWALTLPGGYSAPNGGHCVCTD